MSKELLRHGDTTANTYIDPGAETREAYDISKKSRTLARSIVGNENREDRIRQRCSVAVGDFGMADLMRFSHNPVAATLSALLKGAPIITDIRMVQVGILKKGHTSEVSVCTRFRCRDRPCTRNYPQFSRFFRAQGKTQRIDCRYWQCALRTSDTV